MILHSIVIEHVRGIEHLELTDIPEAGVLVIFGENEAGKSTILDALHTVLNVRHTSMAKGIKALQPVGQDAGPRIRVEAAWGRTVSALIKRICGRNPRRYTSSRQKLNASPARRRISVWKLSLRSIWTATCSKRY